MAFSATCPSVSTQLVLSSCLSLLPCAPHRPLTAIGPLFLPIPTPLRPTWAPYCNSILQPTVLLLPCTAGWAILDSQRCWRVATAPTHSVGRLAMWRLRMSWRTATTTASTGEQMPFVPCVSASDSELRGSMAETASTACLVAMAQCPLPSSQPQPQLQRLVRQNGPNKNGDRRCCASRA